MKREIKLDEHTRTEDLRTIANIVFFGFRESFINDNKAIIPIIIKK